MNIFFNDPGDKDLSLYIPGYSYFQGMIYSNGNVHMMGPIRVIGGIICQRKDPDDFSEAPKSIKLDRGAMLTTNPDYLGKKMTPPGVRLRITKWKEVPTTVKERD